MKISEVECIVLVIPDYRTDANSSAQDDLVVRIHTDEGLYGVGETDTNPWVAKAMIEAQGTHQIGQGLTEMLIGEDPRDVESIWEKLYAGSLMTGRRGLGICAIGAIDMALWDLCGKIENQPCWRLLGGAAHERITPYASLLPEGENIPEYTKSLVERTVAARDLGFKAAKLEVLIKGPFTHHSIRVDDDDEIVRIVEACRKAVGPDMTLMLDVLYCWGDWKRALNVFTKLEESDIYFVETPLRVDDTEGYTKLTAASPIRVAAGELLNSRFEFRELMDRDALDVVQPDVGRVGGLTEARRVAVEARDRGLTVVPHCWKTAIGIAASMHPAAISHACEYIEFLPPELCDTRLRTDLVLDEYPVVDGTMALPDRPGLGITLNEKAIAEFRVA